MIFLYHEFIENLKTSVIQQHKLAYTYWVNNGACINYEKEKFYKYFKLIEPINYKHGMGLENDFDWDLLLRLIVLSNSCDYEFIYPKINVYNAIYFPKTPDLNLKVKNTQGSILKSITDLQSFQIHKLFAIYFLENILLWGQTKQDNLLAENHYKKKVNIYNRKIKAINHYFNQLDSFEVDS